MYTNGVDSARTVAMLIGLTGNLDVPGGNVFMPFARQSVLPTKAVPREKRLGFETFPLFLEIPFPAVKEALWETAANCGFDIDQSNPAAPSSIYSGSHTAGVASPDPTVEMTWVTPTDDASGANAYFYLFRLGSPGLPDSNQAVVDANSCTLTRLVGWWSVDLVKGLSPVP